MMKKALSFLICVLLLITLLPQLRLPAEAATASGTCGKSVSWTLSDTGTLTISGTGPMTDFSLDFWCAPWYDSGNSIKTVVIEEGVTTIGSDSFAECYNLTRITIPQSVTKIGDTAFSSCTALPDVTIPAGVKTIGYHAFMNCSSLKSITFLGSAPSMQTGFHDVSATAYHPCNDETWTDSAKNLDCKSITWVGHVFSNYVIEQEATCAANAVATGTCSVCGATGTLAVPGSIREHSYNEDEMCVNCPDTLRDITINMTSDDIAIGGWDGASIRVFVNGVCLTKASLDDFCNRGRVIVPYIPCAEYTFLWSKGNSKVSCDYTILLGNSELSAANETDKSVICRIKSSRNHRYQALNTAPTCTGVGIIGNTCLYCNVVEAVDTIPPTGHSYGDGVCTVCQEVQKAPTTGNGTCGTGLCWNVDNTKTLTISGSGTMNNYYSYLLPWYNCTYTNVVIEAGVASLDSYAFKYCRKPSSITFLGSPPIIGSWIFEDVTAQAYYPCNDATWTDAVKGNYGGHITWIANHNIGENGLCTDCGQGPNLIIKMTDPEGNGKNAGEIKVYCDGELLSTATVPSGESYQTAAPYRHGKAYTFQWTGGSDDSRYEIIVNGKVLSSGRGADYSDGETVYTLENIADHQNETVITPPTCTAEGYTTKTCTYCGLTETFDIVPATGHSYEKDVVPPTCTEGGITTDICTTCGRSVVLDTPPATGHHYDAAGLCVDCDLQFSLTVSMTDTYGDGWNGSAIAVYANGTLLTEVSLPEEKLTGSFEVPYVPGQLYQLRWKSGSSDSECGFKITLNGETLASGQGSSCTDGQLLCTFKIDCAHTLADFTVTPPTCTEEGSTIGTCTACGYSGTVETTPATGHSYVDGVCTACQKTEILASGICGNDLRWQLDVFGTLTVSGTGAMNNYTVPEDGGEPNTPWYPYCQSITKIVIENGATTIGEYAFHSCTELTEISIPETVTAIGKLAFYNCTGLTEIALPEGLTTIGNAAFRRCSNLTAITIPDGITAIGKITFFDCTALTEVTIPESVTTIGEYAFGNCTALNSITFQGDAPTMNSTCFKNVTATANHPCNETWTDTAKQNYGGTITWKAVHRYENGFCTGCERRLPGDVTGDGKLNIMDVARLYAHIKGTGTITDLITLNVADFTGDGKVNILDIVGLYAHIKG